MISVVIISKDEPALNETLMALRKQASDLTEPCEILVVDASAGRLDYIRQEHDPDVRWIQFERPPGARITIPHQRNAGVRAANGDIIVFTDCGCYPDPGWLVHLTAPLRAEEEDVTAGPTFATADDASPYSNSGFHRASVDGYLDECPTINMAFMRAAFDAVGGFDEGFEYGSDIDFSWRLRAAGFRIRAVSDAIIRHDWGNAQRQLRRSYLYGKARARLHRKHGTRLRQLLRDDPIVAIYPIFLIGLPITLVSTLIGLPLTLVSAMVGIPLALAFPLYTALLLIPAWRNRSSGVKRVLVDHLAYGAGVLAEIAGR